MRTECLSAPVRARRSGLRLGDGRRRRAGDVGRRVDVVAGRRGRFAMVHGRLHAHVPLAGDGHHPLRPVRDPGRAQQAHEEAAQLHRRADLHATTQRTSASPSSLRGQS